MACFSRNTTEREFVSRLIGHQMHTEQSFESRHNYGVVPSPIPRSHALHKFHTCIQQMGKQLSGKCSSQQQRTSQQKAAHASLKSVI